LRSLQDSGHLAKLKNVFFEKADAKQIRQLSTILDEGRDQRASRDDELHQMLVGDFRVGDLNSLSKSHPQALFELCMPIAKYHSWRGSTDHESAWYSFSEQFIAGAWENTAQKPLQDYVTGRINLDVNLYNFRAEEDDNVRNASGFLLKTAELRLGHGPAQGKNVEAGKILNTLAARAAYRGQYEMAIENCNKALKHFLDRVDLAGRVQRHLAFIILEQYNQDEATASLSKYVYPVDSAGSFFGLTTYQQHFLARYYRQYPEGITDEHRKEFSEVLDKLNPKGHPGVLISYNIGFLVNNPTLRARLWGHSAEQAAVGEATVRPMALLPLAALNVHDPSDITTLDQASQIVEFIRNSNLNKTHFAPVLTAIGPAEVLTAVREQEAALFPFDFH